MHIAYLIPTIDRIGGAERQLIQLATGMAHRGWRVTVIALSGSGSHSAEELSANNVSFLSLEMRRGLADPRGWNRLRCWITSAGPDILHSHLPHASLMARAIRLIAPVRVLIDTIHSPATGSIARRIGYRLTRGLPNVVTGVSRSALNPWLDSGMVHHSESTVIPNGVDTHYWKRNAEFRIPSGPHSHENFRWLSVGRFDPVKDHATLLRAFALLPNHASLAIAGSGPLESALRRLAQSLHIEDRISFLGFQADVRRLMQESDAFVLTSRWEGLPVALMEASACELPSVFTHTGGACELLPHASFPPVPIGGFAPLGATMQALMNLPHPERRKLGLKARQHIAASFDLNSTLTRYEALYCHMLAVNPQALRLRSPSGSPLQAPVCSSTPKT